MDGVTKFRPICLIFLLALTLNSFAAKNVANPLESQKQSIDDYQQKIDQLNNNIFKLNSQILKLEDDLGETNQNYLEVIKNKRDSEYKIFKLKTDLRLVESDLEKRRKTNQKLLSAVMVTSLEDNDDPATLLSKKFLAKQLNNKLDILNQQITASRKLKNELSQLSNNFDKMVTKERNLVSHLSELEYQKKWRRRITWKD